MALNFVFHDLTSGFPSFVVILIHKKITLPIWQLHWINNSTSKAILFDLVNLSLNWNLVQHDKEVIRFLVFCPMETHSVTFCLEF